MKKGNRKLTWENSDLTQIVFEIWNPIFDKKEEEKKRRHRKTLTEIDKSWLIVKDPKVNILKYPPIPPWMESFEIRPKGCNKSAFCISDLMSFNVRRNISVQLKPIQNKSQIKKIFRNEERKEKLQTLVGKTFYKLQ